MALATLKPRRAIDTGVQSWQIPCRTGNTLKVVPDLHPGVAALAPLIGTWVGEGNGEYPTIEPFSYIEEVTIGHVGKPFLTYKQRTRSPHTGAPMHAEVGYFRLPAADRVELVVAHPTGIAEVEEGTVSMTGNGLVLEMNSTNVGLTTSAKDVKALSRTFHLDLDELSYTVRMGAVGYVVQHHLSATLRRQA